MPNIPRGHMVLQQRPDAPSAPHRPTHSHSSESLSTHLVHLPNELVDVRFPVAEVTTLHVVLELACPPATSGVGELEGPEEVRCL